MTVSRYRWCFGSRLKCFIVGYLHLIAVLVDIICHVVVVAITTNGFQCDVSESSMRLVDWPWLEPILLVVNIGTHGFYPLPLTFTRKTTFVEFIMPLVSQPTCYPGMFHVYMIDVLNFMINLIWLYFVRSFVKAVHKRDSEPMRMFFGISVLKLILQIMYFGYQPEFRSISSVETFWFIKLVDIGISAICMLIIYEYIKVVMEERRNETTTIRVIDQPPSYVECLIGTPHHVKEEKKEAVVDTQPEAGTSRPASNV